MWEEGFNPHKSQRKAVNNKFTFFCWWCCVVKLQNFSSWLPSPFWDSSGVWQLIQAVHSVTLEWWLSEQHGQFLALMALSWNLDSDLELSFERQCRHCFYALQPPFFPKTGCLCRTGRYFAGYKLMEKWKEMAVRKFHQLTQVSSSSVQWIVVAVEVINKICWKVHKTME